MGELGQVGARVCCKGPSHVSSVNSTQPDPDDGSRTGTGTASERVDVCLVSGVSAAVRELTDYIRRSTLNCTGETGSLGSESLTMYVCRKFP